jgi:photosystem II stability/assembly factor-like uncharacterized protein
VSGAWVATVGQGLWHSDDLEHWSRAGDVPPDARIYALAGEPGVAGGDGAVWVADGARWTRRALPDADLQVWSLALDPRAPGTLYAGCRPLALLRSEDGGASWESLPLTLPVDAPRPHTPRVTTIVVEHDRLWCGVEVGGVFVSEDGGKHWSPDNDGLPSLDVHALLRGRDGALLAALPVGVARRDARWAAASLNAPWRYCRALADTGETLLCGLGDGPPGHRGAVVVAEDGGRSWHSALWPGAADSAIWTLSAAGDDVLAGAIGGEVFASEDAGRTWRRLSQRFGEIRAVRLT